MFIEIFRLILVPLVQHGADHLTVSVLGLEMKPLTNKPLLVVFASGLLNDVSLITRYHNPHERRVLVGGLVEHVEFYMQVRIGIGDIAIQRHKLLLMWKTEPQ